MKFIHTADWHLGKLVQGVYMTEDQRYVLDQIDRGDRYDRAIPPTETVGLLNSVLERIVIERSTPVLAISGNHDSPAYRIWHETYMSPLSEDCYSRFKIYEE
jgi:exonuclease SbcD